MDAHTSLTVLAAGPLPSMSPPLPSCAASSIQCLACARPLRGGEGSGSQGQQWSEEDVVATHTAAALLPAPLLSLPLPLPSSLSALRRPSASLPSLPGLLLLREADLPRSPSCSSSATDSTGSRSFAIRLLLREER